MAATNTNKVEWITVEDGHEIFTKTWYAVGTPVAAIVFIHGLGEHIVRKFSKKKKKKKW